MADYLTQLAQNIQFTTLKLIHMSNVKNNQSADSKNAQAIDRSLLEYLKPKPEDRYSKLEAYCDLLSRAATSAYTAKVGGQPVELLPGQFVATISELGRKWQWQRATVRQFLEGLEELGQISSEAVARNFVFSINLQQRLSIYISSSDDVLDFCAMQFARFIQGRTTAEEVANSYVRYYGMKMEVAIEEGGNGAPVKRVIQQQAAMFNELASSIYRILNHQAHFSKELSDSVSLLFGRDHLWDWHKVIDCLGILAIAMRDKSKPSYMDEVNEHFTKAEVTLLDCIFEHYCSNDDSTYCENPPRPSKEAAEGKKEAKPDEIPSDKSDEAETA